ncbi:MAG: hypothetical protein NTZ38_00885 [Candidatus Taylorbacteria bacterium]|nr:hypothetical protein [Candidatus Taylorbacteria bacterium]
MKETVTSEEISLNAPDVRETALSIERAVNPYITLADLETICSGDERKEQLLKDVVIYSLRYAETLCRFQQIAMRSDHDQSYNEARVEIETVRTSVHNATIDAVNALVRSLTQDGENGPEWVEKLYTVGRSAYGKFAILLAFEVVLQ